MNKIETFINKINEKTSKDEFWTILQDIIANYEDGVDLYIRRSNGIYFTNLDLAEVMVRELFDKNLNKKIHDINKLTFLEPCVGLGSFVFSYLKKISELDLKYIDPLKIIENIYVCDVNEESLKYYQEIFIKFCHIYFNISIDKNFFTNKISKGLLFDFNQAKLSYINIKNSFNFKDERKFDIIITNPPYKNLKVESNKYNSEELAEKDRKKYEYVSNYVKENFTYSKYGVLNLYKLFVEEIICNYSHENSVVSLLVPTTILTDKSCSELRNLILNKNCLLSVKCIKEKNEYIKAQQSVCTLLIEKSNTTTLFEFINNYNHKVENEIYYMDYKDILSLNIGNSIFPLSENEFNLLKKLENFPKVKDLDFIINMRGEFDVTLNKNSLIENVKEFPLVRGKDISYYKLDQSKLTEWINPKFVEECSKKTFISQERISCQQIANINKDRRICFVYVPKNIVLANSSNFMTVLNNNLNYDIFALLGIMNSKLINWLFKLTSSNNHINNYELDMLPLPTNTEKILEISKLVKDYLITNNCETLNEIEDVVLKAYEISIEDNNNNKIKGDEQMKLNEEYLINLNNLVNKNIFNKELAEKLLSKEISIKKCINDLSIILDKFTIDTLEQITNKYIKINSSIILNHTTFKLSELDQEMIISIPQGGNWKNIKQEVIEKSQRLKTIQKTGGRTTLYGRLDYNKPSYTITTYFNRPGNGTYVHPIHNRVISVREAARLQSFKDDYYFTGNKTDILKQVGNAVPPLLSFAIGQEIKKQIDIKTSIDMFCGAGGMTSGLSQAGVKSLLGLDFNRSACITFKVNNPESKVLWEDITKQEVKDNIVSFGKQFNVDLVCGGPPCQGFSHAGKRFIDDPRNQLFKDYIEVVSRINPKVVIMENVHGMLTMDNGRIFNEVLNLFTSLGYNVEGRLLLASDYSVPQKRKRLIFIAVRKDLNVKPNILFPQKTTETNPITTKDAIQDLESIDCGEHSTYEPNYNNLTSYVKLLRK